MLLAEWTGLEPATPGVTGRYSNQLNYHSSFADPKQREPRRTASIIARLLQSGRVMASRYDYNPCFRFRCEA